MCEALRLGVYEQGGGPDDYSATILLQGVSHGSAGLWQRQRSWAASNCQLDASELVSLLLIVEAWSFASVGLGALRRMNGAEGHRTILSPCCLSRSHLASPAFGSNIPIGQRQIAILP